MNETYPAEKATLDELFTAVQRDRPQDVDKQAENWKALSRGLKAVVAAIDLHESQVSRGASSRTTDAFAGELSRMRGRFDEASTMAASNAGNVESVARHMRSAGSHISQLYLQREATRAVATAVGGDTDPAKTKEIDKEYDEQAQYAMWSYARDAKWSADSVQPPTESPGRDSLAGPDGGAPGSGGPGGSGPNGSGPGGSGPGGSSPRPDNGGHFDGGGQSPQLQTPPPGPAPAPSPGPAPAVPPPHSGPPPVLPPPSGGLPPGGLPPGGKPPLPPGTKPPSTLPGGTKPTPPGAKPTLPPTRPGTYPPGTKPPGSPPTSGPRPPQSTVKPVIGSRPGSTGMAPTGTGNRPGTSGVGRPVIGSRPGPMGVPGGGNPGTAPASRPAPAKALIGSNGVVGNGQRAQSGVRVPKTHFGGAGTNRSVISGVRQAFQPGTGLPAPAKGGTKRDAESQYRPEGGDHQWTVDREVVPGVISGGDWTGREHHPGAVAELRGRPERADETATVERLSKPAEAAGKDDDYWNLPTGGRGVVVRGRTRRYDANDW